MEKIDNKSQGQIFRNPYLEALTKTSPMITLITYGSIVMVLLFINFRMGYSNMTEAILFYCAGIFSWTLVEYSLHRYIFHFISDSQVVQRFHFMIHGVHHQYPRDHERLFMPPVPGILIASILFLLFKLILGSFVFSFLPGLVTGYMIYTFMHYSMHKIKPPKFLKGLWAHHALHHYKYPEKAFGVSTLLWDRVFGTMPPKK